MIGEVLNQEQERLLAQERAYLTDLLSRLARLQAEPADETTLKQAIEQLDELFLLVVIGEFNAGKSAFVNTLLGEKVLDEGVTPTTKAIHVLGYGEPSTTVTSEVQRRITAKVELLRSVNIVDTPGTNAIHREHQAITEEFVPRSDLVLFVTSADRPFTESERGFLEKIRKWGKKVVFVINKIDILEDQDAVDQVEQFVRVNVRRLLGFEPEIFSVSCRQAWSARSKSPPVGDGGFAELEEFIRRTLDERERVRLKLLNPLGVGMNLAEKYLRLLGRNLELLGEDWETLQTIEAQGETYQEDMRREFGYRLADIRNVLLEFETRGVEFFDDRLKLTRIAELLNKSKLKLDFEKKVVGPVPQEIERRVQEIIDWMVSGELSHWQSVMGHLNRSRTVQNRQLLGEVGGRFQYDRTRLLNSVGQRAQRVVEGYDQEVEARQLAEQVQVAVAGTALMEAGAIGLGTAVTLLASSTLADVTGIVAAGTLAVLGLFVLPARRSKAKRDLHLRIAQMKDQLMEALESQFARELRASLQRVEEAISPYSRFVRTEKEKFSKATNELQDSREKLAVLRAELE